MEIKQVVTGRRASDKWLQELLQSILDKAHKPSLGSGATIVIDPVIPTTGGRRPRRTRKQLNMALYKAVQAVRKEKPHWSSRRINTRARNLVKLYKF